MNRIRSLRTKRGIPPGPPSVGLAADLYIRGDLRLAVEAAALTARAEPRLAAEPLLIGGHAALRVRDDQRALTMAAALRDGDVPGWRVIEGFARARSGDPETGKALLRQSLASENASERCDAAYRLALFDWNERRTAEAEEVVLRYLPEARGLNRCLLEQMLGWIEVARERHAIAGRHFEQALRTFKTEELHDEWLRQRLLQAITIVALETIDFGLVPLEVPLDSDLGQEAREPAFHTAQNLAWLSMLKGREVDALELFQRARSLAVTPALVSVAEVNLAGYHRVRGDRAGARDHLELARRHLVKQPWSEANADERMTLLEYAIEAHQLEPTSAGGTLMRYLSVELRSRSSLAFERDGRVGATELTARAALEAIHGRSASALKLLAGAVEAWRAIGYRFREAQTLLLLHDLSGRPEHLAAVERAVEVAPRSWLQREVARRRGSLGGPATLTPAERRVMAGICAGKSSRQIASDLGRSFHTVRNQTLGVYKAMGVQSRAALVAECARRGLLQDGRR